MANEREGQEQEKERRGAAPDLRAQRSESRTTQTYVLFLRDLEKKANIGRERAEQAAQSVLCLLEQRLMGDEVRHLEAQLPHKVRDLLQRCPRHQGTAPRKFKLEQFLTMVSEDLDTTPNEAERLSRAVFATVREHISEGEAEDVMGQLPPDLRALWAREA